MRSRVGRRLAVVAAGCVVLVVHGCGEEEIGSREYRVGDTLVVESLAPLIRDTIDPIEVDRVGQPDGPLSYLFTNIYAFTVAFDGTLFVHDSDDGIREFDPEGRFVRYLARDGQGPREVRYLLGMDVDSAGRLAVLDLGNARVSVLGAKDDDLVVFRRPSLMPRFGDGSIRFHTDGTLWVGVHPMTPSEGGIPHPRLAYLQYNSDGVLLDSIVTPVNAAGTCTVLSETEFRVGFWEDRREPFLPKVTWALGPNGSFAIGCPADYVLDVHRPNGDVIRVNRAWDPLMMTDDARERMVRQSGLNPPPRRRPAYGRIILPGDGRIWVWPNQPLEEIELDELSATLLGRTHGMRIATHGAFDVFTSGGRWLATVRLPAEVPFSGFPTERSLLIRGDTIWAIAKDEFDVQYVVRYQVPGLDRTPG